MALHRHGLAEDALALLFGCVFVATGMAILRGAGLVTGGMAGLALLASHFLPLSPGVLLALFNVPFLVLAWRAIGPLFAVRTVMASIGIAALSQLWGRRCGSGSTARWSPHWRAARCWGKGC